MEVEAEAAASWDGVEGNDLEKTSPPQAETPEGALLLDDELLGKLPEAVAEAETLDEAAELLQEV